MKSILQYALEHVRRGWPVFPLHNPDNDKCSCGNKDCHSPAKHPRTLNGFKDASNDVSQVREWWSQWPDANIGIATGASSGVVVVDIDEPKGGSASLRNWRRQYGDLPTGPCSRTGHGEHNWFAQPSVSIKSMTGLAEGIDIRANGGYVVGAGSRHISGVRYVWFEDLSPEEVALPALPDWLLQLMTGGPRRNGQVIPTGQRNVTLASLAGTLRAKGMAVPEIEIALLLENKQRCSPPLTNSEVRRIVASIGKYPSRSAGGGNRKTVSELLAESGFNQLAKGVTPDEVERTLRRLSQSLTGTDTLQRTAVRQAAIQLLQNADVKSPGRLLDSAFQLLNQPTQHQQGSEVLFPEIEAWPDAVDGEELIASIVEIQRRYLVLPKWGATAIALWIVHTHAIEASNVSPYLAIVSPEKRCGKSSLLSLLQKLVRRPLPSSNISPAAVFRVVEKYGPTLLVDEADRYLKADQELTGILNSGHSRDLAKVIRVAGDDFQVQVFSTFGPKAIAMIGSLPSTLEDRSLVIAMKRRSPDESVRRFRPDRVGPSLSILARKIARWVADHLDDLKNADPSIPEELNDRAQDNWVPLLAIADLVGGAYPERSRKAAIGLSAANRVGDSSVGPQLLADIQDLFRDQNSTQLPTTKIIEELTRMHERPWPEWKHGQPMTATQLARLLSKFGIHPKQNWIDGANLRGYVRDDFQDAFRRYLPH